MKARPVFGGCHAALLCRLQRCDIVGIMPQGQRRRLGTRAAAEPVGRQPAQRTGQVHNRRHTGNRQRVRVTVAGGAVDLRTDQQGTDGCGQFRKGSIFEVIAPEVGLVKDPHVATTSPSGPSSTLLKFQLGTKPCSLFSQA